MPTQKSCYAALTEILAELGDKKLRRKVMATHDDFLRLMNGLRAVQSSGLRYWLMALCKKDIYARIASQQYPPKVTSHLTCCVMTTFRRFVREMRGEG